MHKLSPGKLITQVAVSIGVIAIFNIVVNSLSRNTIPRQVLLNIQSSENISDLFVGNSLVAAGFNPKIFGANLPQRKAINLGLGSSSPVEHYLLLKSSVKHSKANIYYGFFDTQLTDAIKSDYESLFGNRAASYYIEPETAISLYAPNDFMKAWQLRLVGKVPMLVERAALWANVERVRRILGETGMPGIAVNQFGRNEDFQKLEPLDRQSFAQTCQNTVQFKAGFNSGINSILELANQRNVKTVFVLMPMNRKHRDRFYNTSSWIKYKDYLDNLILKEGGSLIDASDWITDSGFSDGLHLNKLGADLFSQRITTFREFHK